MRELCYQCFRPKALCFCEAIPQIDNRTNVLILQHVGERFHPFNTARIVQTALRRSHLIADHNHRFGNYQLPLQADAGLLYPRENATPLSELAEHERPTQLVVIDGTWHQAKTIVRDAPQLAELPCYRLTPAAPGQYRIRREPDQQSLSTVEATVAALRALEPDTPGLDQLLSAFDRMVESQLRQRVNRNAWRRRHKSQSRPRHVPQALLGEADGLVVAYGEATPGHSGQCAAVRTPVNWVAKRLGTDHQFSCCLRQPQPLASAAMEHMRLSVADINGAAARDDFCQQWKQFLRRNDVLIVYHQRTYQLLRNIQAAQPRCLVLKSIFGKWRTGFQSLEELLTTEGITLAKQNTSRAKTRLEMAVALVEHLRARCGHAAAS